MTLASAGIGTFGATTLSTTSVSITGAAYDYANANYTGTTVDFGYLHTGASAASQSVAFGNATKTNAALSGFAECVRDHGQLARHRDRLHRLGRECGRRDDSQPALGVSTATPGSLASTENLTLVSNANGVSGLSNGTPTVVGGGTISTDGHSVLRLEHLEHFGERRVGAR